MCGLIALVKDADAALLPSFPIGIGTITIGSRCFCLYQAGAAVALWIAVLRLLLRSKKDHVVLSPRN